jgi:hypothetical protein
MESDQLSHVYTLILKSDNTYEVQIDTVKAESGSLYDDWDFLLPKKIKDPKESKPKDWVDDAQIPDPADVKPAGYDDIPAKIPDAAAKIPEDWDVEEDGEWTAPQVDNPAYKGPWKAKMIANPAYKGVWVRCARARARSARRLLTHRSAASPAARPPAPRRRCTRRSTTRTSRTTRRCTPSATRARTLASSSGR